jgi:hypothetical protein
MSNYDPWITIKKMFIVMAFGAAVGGCEAGVVFLQGDNFPPEYVIYTTVGIMILTAIANYIKHRKD